MSENQLEKKPIIRRARKNYVVEENIQEIQWPAECVVCGNAKELDDNLILKSKFKNLGKIQVEVKDIPYCQICFPKIRRGKTIDKMRNVVAYVLGIPLGIYLTVLSMQDQQRSGSGFVWIGMIFLVAIAIGYGLSWLLVKLPVKLILKKNFAMPVDGWLIEEKKKDGREGISIVISIPNSVYSAKFAELNKVA